MAAGLNQTLLGFRVCVVSEARFFQAKRHLQHVALGEERIALILQCPPPLRLRPQGCHLHSTKQSVSVYQVAKADKSAARQPPCDDRAKDAFHCYSSQSAAAVWLWVSMV